VIGCSSRFDDCAAVDAPRCVHHILATSAKGLELNSFEWILG
jgi:hypothetical protein